MAGGYQVIWVKKGVLLGFQMLICVEIGRVKVKDASLVMCLNLRNHVLRVSDIFVLV